MRNDPLQIVKNKAFQRTGVTQKVYHDRQTIALGDDFQHEILRNEEELSDLLKNNEQIMMIFTSGQLQAPPHETL